MAEAIEAGGNVARAARCAVLLCETVEVLAQEVHVAVLAPLRQPIELSGRDWRHLGEHPKVKGFLGVREAEPDEAIEGVLQAAVTSRNLEGGMTAWNEAGQPLVRDDGSPGVVA